jgi:hypothetical protein
MFTKGSDQALTVEVSALSALPSVVAEDVAGLKRKSRRSSRGGHGGGNTNMCLISLQDSLNGLNVLNIFGGGLGL